MSERLIDLHERYCGVNDLMGATACDCSAPDRIDAVEAERDAALAKLAKAHRWIANCVDPVAVGFDVKQQMLAELAAVPGVADERQDEQR